MPLNAKQIESVLALPGPKRYSHFIKEVADKQEVWGLYDEGWALAGSDEGEELFLIWPAKEYAALRAIDDWAHYQPSAIPLEEFMDVLVPGLEADGLLPGVFYTPSGQGVVLTFSQLLEDLRHELGRYMKW